MGFRDQFGAGLTAGFLVLVGELEFFASSLIADAFSKTMQTLPSGSVATPLFSSLSLYLFLFIVVDIVQNFFIGFKSPIGFATGFLCGDLFVLLFIAGPMWAVAPEIDIGMLGAFITVLIGLYLRYKANE